MAENQDNNTPKPEETKCPNCGAPLVYDVEKGTLTCSSCGTSVDLGCAEEYKISGFDFEDVESQVTEENAEDIPIFNCVSCGADILAAKEEVSLTCPYCGNNIVLTDRVSGKLRPNAVIPFKITPKELPDALNRFYKDKVLLPRDFFSEKSVGKVTGIYVPFWSFTGEVSGDLSYHAQNRIVRETANEEITTVNEYRLLRSARVSFENLILDASEKMDDATMDSIMPYDLSEARDFNMGYLAGFAADRFDVRSEKLSERAENRMRNSAYRAVSGPAGAGYTSSRLVGGALNAAMQKVQYLLLPVYVFDIKYQGKPYHYAVNGQTGKVVGTVPIGKDACRRFQAVRALIGFAIVMAVFVILYFLGV